MMNPLLLQGDCLELMKTLPDKSVDCFLTDLPYGQLSTAARSEESKIKYNRGRGVGSGEGCPWDIAIDLTKFWEQVERLMKTDETPILMFCNTRFGITLINSKPSWFRYDLVWNKMCGVSFLQASKAPMKAHEMVYVFAKRRARYTRIDEVCDKPAYSTSSMKKRGFRHYGFTNNVDWDPPAGTAGEGKRCSLSVIHCPNAKGPHVPHPTTKPLPLLVWLLRRYCPPGGTVLDPTAGSFNSVRAAVSLGMRGIGIEMDPVFFKKAHDSFYPEPTASVPAPTANVLTHV
jgi:site-specific DNA-methyltransferase (adenine-specific)